MKRCISIYAYGTITLYSSPFQDTSALSGSRYTSPHLCLPFERRFGLPCSQFARCYYGNHNCFLFLPVLRCFNSRRHFASQHTPCGVRCRIRKSWVQCPHAAHPGLSQLATSFIIIQAKLSLSEFESNCLIVEIPSVFHCYR